MLSVDTISPAPSSTLFFFLMMHGTFKCKKKHIFDRPERKTLPKYVRCARKKYESVTWCDTWTMNARTVRSLVRTRTVASICRPTRLRITCDMSVKARIFSGKESIASALLSQVFSLYFSQLNGAAL